MLQVNLYEPIIFLVGNKQDLKSHRNDLSKGAEMVSVDDSSFSVLGAVAERRGGGGSSWKAQLVFSSCIRGRDISDDICKD